MSSWMSHWYMSVLATSDSVVLTGMARAPPGPTRYAMGRSVGFEPLTSAQAFAGMRGTTTTVEVPW